MNIKLEWNILKNKIRHFLDTPELNQDTVENTDENGRKYVQ